MEGKLWRTKGSRFNANKRITIKNQWSRYSMGLLSAYVIIINVYPVVLKSFATDDISDNLFNFIPFFSIALGILILVINITEGTKGLNLQAERMLSSAKEISKLYNRLKLQSSLNEENIKDEVFEITKEYNSIISKYDNHEPIDYEYFKTNHPDEFKLNFCQKSLIKLRYFVMPILWYFALILMPFIIISWFIWTTSNKISF